MKDRKFLTIFKILALISAIGLCGFTAKPKEGMIGDNSGPVRQLQEIDDKTSNVQSVPAEQKGNNSNPVSKADKKTQAKQYYLQGVKYYGNAEYQKAKDSWTKAYQLDPENEDVRIALKRINQVLLLQKGKNSQQEKPSAKPSADAKRQASQYYLQGVKYYGNAEYQKAKDSWTKAYQLDPENEDVSIALKRINQVLLLQKGQNSQQGKPSAKPAEDAKSQAKQYYLEGLMFYGNEEYRKAKDAWTKAQQLDPENREVRLGLERIEQIMEK